MLVKSDSPPDILNLIHDELHIWSVSLFFSEEKLGCFLSIFSEDELERASRFKNSKTRERFIASRGVLRNVLARYLGVSDHEVEFDYQKHGKPILGEKFALSGLQFNLTHCENFALVAVCRGCVLGIDLESMNRVAPFEAITKRFFSQQEYEELRHAPEEDKKRMFFNGWTRKEAFVKAIGAGLTYPMNHFSVSMSSDKPTALLSTQDDTIIPKEWMLFSLDVIPNYAASVAIKGKPKRTFYWHWSP